DREGSALFDYRVWVLASDGDLMEGVASEASSLAGHLGLDRLVVLWDDNRISIDGGTDLAFTEDVCARYRAYGWRVLEVDDVNDLAALDTALAAASEESDRPAFVRVRTHIGFGAPRKQGTAAAHGSPLGAEELRAAKENLGWPLEPTFHVPDAAREEFADARRRGAEAHAAWRRSVDALRAAQPELGARLDGWLAGELPSDWMEALPTFAPDQGPIATRAASGKVLSALAERLPQLLGGSADLAGSNQTFVKGREIQARDVPGGANFHFGVREHAMAAAANGMALSGMLRPYVGTFLIFADYLRPALRLAALMGTPTIFVLTHDSIFLGEDGPTHQPVAVLASLRALPNVLVLRPADANETVAAWKLAIETTDRPTCLVLTRQKLPVLEEIGERAIDGVARGGYVVAEDAAADVTLLATGSEVSLALAARAELAARDVSARVVSLPSWKRFDALDASDRDAVLGAAPRLAIEAACSFGWHRYLRPGDDVLAQDGFGASAPAGRLAEHFGFTAEHVADRAQALVGDGR
ncbi:MAG: transketolase, partial [Acidobacteriota bacterium]